MTQTYRSCTLTLFALALFISAMAVAATPSGDYTWVEVKSGDFNLGLHVTGRVIPQDGALHIESARVQGRVVGILRREGEYVRKGTPLFEISSAECLSLIEEKKVAERQGLQDLIQGVTKREKQLGLSLQAEHCQLLANEEGTLTKRSVESGATFNPGDPLVTILNVGRLSIELDLPEQDLSKVKPEQRVKLQLASRPEQSLSTRVQYVVPTIDATTRTIKVRLRPFALPKGTTLDALVFGDIETGTNEVILSVPTSALVFQNNKQYVVKQATPTPLSVAVQVVSETETQSSIRPLKEGELKSGDRIIGKGALFVLRKLNAETLP